MNTHKMITFGVAIITIPALGFVKAAQISQDLQIMAIILLTSLNIIPHIFMVSKKATLKLQMTFLYGLLFNSCLFAPVLFYEVGVYIGLHEIEMVFAIIAWIIYLVFIVTLYFNAFPPKPADIEEKPFYQVTDVLMQPKNQFALEEADQAFIPLNTTMGKSIAIKVIIGVLTLSLLTVIL